MGMADERVNLRGAPATLLMTLYLHARDAESAHPILGDRFAAEALKRIDAEGGVQRFDSDTATITARARRLDDWCAAFLAAHPDGQVLHLGCGLDSRPLRVARPAGARWVDLDLPEVIELRRRVYDLPAGVETVAASVTDPGWWEGVQADRPTIAVAEGLFMYLETAGIDTLVDRLTSTVTRGELAFDTVASWTIPMANRSAQFRATGARLASGFDRTAFARRHPELTRLEDHAVTGLAADVSTGARRAGYRLTARLPYLRDTMRVHRYAFGPR